MTNCVDTNFLAMLLHPGVKPPLDPATGLPLDRLPARMSGITDTWNQRGDRLIVPTPALAEFLVLAGADGNSYLSELNNLTHVYIRPFDLRSAIELASMEINARLTGSKRAPAPNDAPWQKVKVDRQIVAIAKVANCDAMYTDDANVRALALGEGMRVTSSWELTPQAAPQDLFPAMRVVTREDEE